MRSRIRGVIHTFAFLHLGFVVVFDDRDRLAAVDLVAVNGVAVEVGNRFDCRSEHHKGVLVSVKK
jgi:hypothetical protein